MKYQFEKIDSCEMCGHNDFKIIGKRLNRSQGIKPHKKTGITTTIVKCKNCGLVFSNPLPIPENLEDHYGMPPESYWTKEQLTISETEFSDTINIISKLKPSGRTLDIGAGIGKAMMVLKKAGYDAYGFEPSKPFYDRAISITGIDENRIMLAPIETAEYPENHFDFISCGAVLEHLYHPSEAIKKAMKWLKPDGLMWIEVPSADWLISKILNTTYRMRGTDYCTNLSPMHPPYHLYEYTLKSFVENGKRNDYSVIRHDYFVCNDITPKPFKMLRSYMKRTNQGLEISVWLKKNSL